ncbi:xanthine dehydrogenase family protein molybdopterin-binding subunit [Deinococcus sp.]|uniref:xanthine dehydrogenase family protein molybdopterin-binding subunit n=1 Tax=Deinococcus sp. TaxID=47478 RepID=UPI0025BA523E|nr:xanthine dehydrogenase family protein molybdopterin-binding subunit [Deinococcus sp.]
MTATADKHTAEKHTAEKHTPDKHTAKQQTAQPALSALQIKSVGQGIMRVDGPQKVTGTAPYAYEQPVKNPAYLFPLVSGIGLGHIKRIEDKAAREVEGVLEILTHRNAYKLQPSRSAELQLLQSPEVHYKGEIIGAVIAETPYAARYAASLVNILYNEAEQDTRFVFTHPELYTPKKINAGGPADRHMGDSKAALKTAAHVTDAKFSHTMQFHSAMEPHSAMAEWHPEKGVTLYDASQGAGTWKAMLAPLLGLEPEQLHIVSPFVGGGFGSKGVPHAPTVLALLAAQLVAPRPVKLMLTRQQHFANVGYRPEIHQHFQLGADAQGKLTAIVQNVTETTSKLLEFAEQTVSPTRMMYAAPGRETTTRLVPLDLPPATFMRAPGEFPGMFALEIAMDEMAEACGLDPIEFRLLNEPERDPENGKPFSVRLLRECLEQGAKQFGWNGRKAPGQHQEGEWLYGMGVASATYPHHKPQATCGVVYGKGQYQVQLAAADLGTGAWTILGQIAADALEVPLEQIDLQIGDSDLPAAGLAGGSMGTYSWSNAIYHAARAFRKEHGEHPKAGAQAEGKAINTEEAEAHSKHTFGAHFAEVKVSSVTGEVRATRMLGIYDAGRIINPRTARSQFLGGMTMGISAALHEEAYLDTRFGHVVNHDFAGYHIAAHADVPELSVEWLDVPDPQFGPLGAKGIGEVGIVGVPAAISNAIYNATGKRLRDLPFTPAKLLEH